MKVNGRERCIGCMKRLDADGRCPYCGFVQTGYEPIPRCLRPGTKLKDRYILGRVLGEGSFGISYVAWDCLLDTVVAIKEYFPSSLVSRHVSGEGDYNVYIYEKAEKQKYQESLKKYLQEAKSLSAYYDMEGIVSVRDFFYENNTAYIVMGYVDGVSVKEYVEENGPIEGEKLLRMLEPVIRSLTKVHQNGVLHRDISPDNILLTRDDRLVLIDFGAARRENINVTRSMTVMFKRGFSPEEQYRTRGRQGAWTDVYALCATAYYALTGKTPDESIQRVLEDDMPSLTDMPELSLGLAQKKALMKGLTVDFHHRYQTMGELYRGLYQEEKCGEHGSGKRKAAAGIIMVSVCLAGVIYLLAGGHRAKTLPVSSPAMVKVTENVVTAVPFATNAQEYVMESFTGLTKKKAAEKLKKQDAKLKIRWKYRYDSEIKKGRILKQSIPEGTKYSREICQEIVLTVSKGKKKVVVPALNGKGRSEAEQILRDKKLGVRWKTIRQTGETGIVVEQSIEAGKRVAAGTIITLTVRKKPVPVQKPVGVLSGQHTKSAGTDQKNSTEFEGAIP